MLLLPHLGPRGETHLPARKGVGEPNSDEGTDTLELCVYYNPPFFRHVKLRDGCRATLSHLYKDDLSKLFLVLLLTHLVFTYSSYKYAVKPLF